MLCPLLWISLLIVSTAHLFSGSSPYFHDHISLGDINCSLLCDGSFCSCSHEEKLTKHYLIDDQVTPIDISDEIRIAVEPHFPGSYYYVVEGNIKSYNVNTRSSRTVFPLSFKAISCNPLFQGGVLVVCSNIIHALDPFGKQELWSYDLNAQHIQLHRGHQHKMFVVTESALLQMSVIDGEIIWSVDFGSTEDCHFSIESSILVTCPSYMRLYLYDGFTLWHKEVGSILSAQISPLLNSVICARRGNLLRLNISTGEEILNAGVVDTTNSLAIASTGELILGTDTGQIHVYSPLTGQLLHRFVLYSDPVKVRNQRSYIHAYSGSFNVFFRSPYMFEYTDLVPSSYYRMVYGEDYSAIDFSNAIYYFGPNGSYLRDVLRKGVSASWDIFPNVRSEHQVASVNVLSPYVAMIYYEDLNVTQSNFTDFLLVHDSGKSVTRYNRNNFIDLQLFPFHTPLASLYCVPSSFHPSLHLCNYTLTSGYAIIGSFESDINRVRYVCFNGTIFELKFDCFNSVIRSYSLEELSRQGYMKEASSIRSFGSVSSISILSGDNVLLHFESCSSESESRYSHSELLSSDGHLICGNLQNVFLFLNTKSFFGEIKESVFIIRQSIDCKEVLRLHELPFPVRIESMYSPEETFVLPHLNNMRKRKIRSISLSFYNVYDDFFVLVNEEQLFLFYKSTVLLQCSLKVSNLIRKFGIMVLQPETFSEIGKFTNGLSSESESRLYRSSWYQFDEGQEYENRTSRYPFTGTVLAPSEPTRNKMVGILPDRRNSPNYYGLCVLHLRRKGWNLNLNLCTVIREFQINLMSSIESVEEELRVKRLGRFFHDAPLCTGVCISELLKITKSSVPMFLLFLLLLGMIPILIYMINKNLFYV